MSKLEHYANKYQSVSFERRNGILQMTLHTEGGSLRWGFGPHGELPEAFHDVGADRDNRFLWVGVDAVVAAAKPDHAITGRCARAVQASYRQHETR